MVPTVENTGKKLTPQLVPTLAEPFQRGTERIRTDHSGVGLGLAIVKGSTQAHDGKLTLTPRAAGGPRHGGGATRRATAHKRREQPARRTFRAARRDDWVLSGAQRQPLANGRSARDS